MKTKLFFLSFLLCCACTNVPKPLSEVEKVQVISEAKEVINTIIQAAEKCESEKMTATTLDSPDFISLINGVLYNHEQFVKSASDYQRDLVSQKMTSVLGEKYMVLDASTVLYTSSSKWQCKLKNDSIAVFEPCGMQFLLKKKNNQWKVLSWVESF